MHSHAFSPLEVWQGVATPNVTLRDFLTRLKNAGLVSLPGPAAENLDDEVRAVLCPEKISAGQWFEVMEAAHGLGIRTTKDAKNYVDAKNYFQLSSIYHIVLSTKQ